MGPLNGGVPVLGQQKPTHAGAQLAALPSQLDANGMFELVNGAVPRDAYWSGADLIDAIRQVVREELAAAVVRGRDTPA